MKSIAKRLDTHFAACAAAAAGAAIVGEGKADAAIVWSGATNITIPSTFAGVYLNVVTGATAGSSGALPGWDVNPYGVTYLRLFSNTGGGHVDGGGGNFNLAPNTLIGPSSTFVGGVANGTGTTIWNLSSSNNLLGFRFINEALGNQVQYGWYRVSLAATIGGQPRAIVEWAYDNAGGSILAGQTPAPGALALLAVGALAGRRRQRAA